WLSLGQRHSRQIELTRRVRRRFVRSRDRSAAPRAFPPAWRTQNNRGRPTAHSRRLIASGGESCPAPPTSVLDFHSSRGPRRQIVYRQVKTTAIGVRETP